MFPPYSFGKISYLTFYRESTNSLQHCESESSEGCEGSRNENS